MHEYSRPAVIDLPAGGNLADLPMFNAIEAPERRAYRYRTTTGWRRVSAGEFWSQVLRLAKGFLDSGVQQGDRVALLSGTRYEWTLTDFALWTAGAVVVPIYDTSAPEQVQWIMSDSAAVGIVVETAEQQRMLSELLPTLPGCHHVWGIDSGGLASLAATAPSNGDGEIERRRRDVGPDDLATIIYTSGTTGRPKGCELTHGNVLFVARTLLDQAPSVFPDDASTLLFLPLAHVFGRMLQVVAAASRTELAFADEGADLLADLEQVRPTYLGAVPRLFEKVYGKARQQAHDHRRGWVFDRAVDVAVAYSQAQQRGSVPPALRVQHAAFDRLVYRRIRDALGGQVRFAISGGALLSEQLAHFYAGLGVHVLDAYGLTETTAATTANLPGATRIGTVGRPLPGTAIRVAEDGEILVQGPHLMRGYHADDQASAEMIEEGWFRTGDLGELDDDGYLRITGRKKEILVTAAGKNVAPASLEDQVREHFLVSQCMVLGDAQPYITALVTVDPEALRTWAASHAKVTLPTERLLDDPDLYNEIQRAVDSANAVVSKAESIRRFRIVGEEWSVTSGHLTPTMKLRRDQVLKDFASEVDRLYV